VKATKFMPCVDVLTSAWLCSPVKVIHSMHLIPQTQRK